MKRDDLKAMNDDEIRNIESMIFNEKQRRIAEAKAPVFVYEDECHKDLREALLKVRAEVDRYLEYKDGPEAYAALIYNGDRTVDLIRLQVKFWSKSEYDARPSNVFEA